MTFGLNALHGRDKLNGTAWGGDWDHTNTQDFMNYTVSKGYAIDSWELGIYNYIYLSFDWPMFVSHILVLVLLYFRYRTITQDLFLSCS